MAIFVINNLPDLMIIINHFYSYPLLTSKRYSFQFFTLLHSMKLNKDHLTVNGFLKSVAIINNLNNPIKPEKLISIIESLGVLPELILPPVTIFDKFVLIPSPW
jgi:hypothetical protein